MRIPHMLASWLTGLAIATTVTAQTLPSAIPIETVPTTIEVAPPMFVSPTIPLFEPITNLHLTKHQDFLMGYSHLFPGSFIKNAGSGIGLDTVYL